MVLPNHVWREFQLALRNVTRQALLESMLIPTATLPMTHLGQVAFDRVCSHTETDRDPCIPKIRQRYLEFIDVHRFSM